jgi:hypothetical protein
MRRIVVALSLIAPLAVAAAPALAAPASAEKAVLAALDTWKEATIKKDRALFEKVYHPELTYGHSSGMLETKEQAIEHVLGNATIYEDITISDTKVKVLGSNLALLTAKLVMKQKGRDLINLVALTVWTKTSKGWQMVGRQATRPPPPAAPTAGKPPGAPTTPTAQTPPVMPPAPPK